MSHGASPLSSFPLRSIRSLPFSSAERDCISRLSFVSLAFAWPKYYVNKCLIADTTRNATSAHDVRGPSKRLRLFRFFRNDFSPSRRGERERKSDCRIFCCRQPHVPDFSSRATRRSVQMMRQRSRTVLSALFAADVPRNSGNKNARSPRNGKKRSGGISATKTLFASALLNLDGCGTLTKNRIQRNIKWTL